MKKEQAVMLLNEYMDGKDNVKEDVLASVFTQNAVVEFDIRPSNINFPDNLKGNKTIAKKMFGDFHNSFTDVKSFYLDSEFFNSDNDISINKQKWLVTMEERDTMNSRIGTGEYNWFFEKENGKWLVSRLEILIHNMVSFTPPDISWLKKVQNTFVNYPWLEVEDAIAELKGFVELEDLVEFLEAS